MAVGRRTNGPKFATSRSASLAPIKGILGLLGSGDLMTFTRYYCGRSRWEINAFWTMPVQL